MNKPTTQQQEEDIKECGCYYGVAPHKHDMSITGSVIGSTVLLPKETWPDNFKEDTECVGLGTFICDSCMKNE